MALWHCSYFTKLDSNANPVCLKFMDIVFPAYFTFLHSKFCSFMTLVFMTEPFHVSNQYTLAVVNNTDV